MNIAKRRVGGTTILDLKGKLTIGDGAEVLRDTVASVVFEGERKILLNLAGVPYMDSGGLGERSPDFYASTWLAGYEFGAEV